jgi:hypothetical protein
MWIASFDIGVRNFAFSVIDADTLSPVVFDCIDLVNTKGDEYSVHTLYTVLGCWNTVWEQCSVFLIEQQMQHRHASNIKAIKIAQHVIGYFHFLFHASSPRPEILEFPAYHKTQTFCKKKMSKYERKKWAVDYMLRFFKDHGLSGLLDTYAKKDDLCDCFLMCLAYCHQLKKNLPMYI